MRFTKAQLKTGLLSSAAACIMLSPSTAFAQDAAEEASDDNAIIITASKRETTLQETPIAVSVTSSEQIEEAQVRDLLDLQTLVPSLRVNQLQSSANTNFSIRGFGNGANNPGIEPSVGVFIDGVYRSRSAAQIGDLPNLERVEVLRGPQSTLFGKNASAGIISIVTRKPQFEFGGSAELSYGNFNAVVAKADITGPISENLAFSLSGNYNRRDGYVRDLALNQDANERNRWGVRGQLLFEPTDNLSLRFIADFDKIDENCCSVVNIVDGPTGGAVRALGGRLDSNNRFSRISYLNFNSSNKIENYGFSLQSDFSVGLFDVTTISAYRAVRTNTNQDSDFTSADLIGFNGGTSSIDTYTSEVRAASDFDGPVNFLVGAYYFKEDIETNAALTYGRDFKAYADLLSGGGYSASEATIRFLIPTTPTGTFGGQGQGRTTNFKYADNAFSIFGQMDFAITEDLTFTVGGNYTNDRKRVIQNNGSTDVFSGIDLVQAGVLAGVPATVAATAANPFLALRPFQFLPPPLNFPNAVESGRTQDSDLSYTFRLAYNFSDNISAYASYATGFKATSFNLGTDSRPFPADFIPGSPFQSPAPAASPIRTALGANVPTNLSIGTRFANPEDAVVYEVGLKGNFDGFAFNLAVFDQTLNDFQGNTFTGTGFVLGNADKRSTFGIEFDASISPVRNFTITTAFTHLNSKYDSFPGGSALSNSFGVVPTDLSGQVVAGVPEWAVTFGGTYTHEFASDAELTFHADFLLESNTQIAGGQPNFRRAVEALNASIALKLGNGLSMTLWGRNLTDATYLTTIFPSVAQSGSLSGYRNQPRTFGGAVKFKF